MRNVARFGLQPPRCQIHILQPRDVVLERRVGSLGVLTVSSPGLRRLGQDASWSELQKIDEPVRTEGVEVRQYEGRMNGGVLAGENVFVKMYPKCPECDALAANELRMYADLQPPTTESPCARLSFLFGGYETTTARCLVFKRTGKTVTLRHYVGMAAKALESGKAVGAGDLWDVLDPRRAQLRRQKFMILILRAITEGLSFMHQNFRLHQSLGPESVNLSQYNVELCCSAVFERAVQEADVSSLKVQIKDLAFGLDVSSKGLSMGSTLEEIWEIASDKEELRKTLPTSEELWVRARSAGAWSEIDKRNFGVADDILSLGLLFLYTLLLAFSPSAGLDGPRLYRLIQTTFESDLARFREYCQEDDQFDSAVAFLDLGGKAGWELLQAMIQADWRSRPTAASCLNHAFLSGALLNESI